jgi:methyltransferase (TIGR00027 family)
LRTRALDEAWHTAHASGTRQLVLLGAGLDGRAFRLNDIADSTVIEVDHPATQQLKKRRVKHLVSRARRHALVPVDFERDRLSDALHLVKQLKQVPTFWLWEGVTPYLTRQAQQATIEAVAECSVAGSRLAMTYIEPWAKPSQRNHRTAITVRLLGEPFIGLMTRDEAADLLRRSRFRVIEDSDPQDWRRNYSRNPNRGLDTLRERIVVGEMNL